MSDLTGKQVGKIIAEELRDFYSFRLRAFEYPDQTLGMEAGLDRVAARLSEPYAEFKDTLLYYALEHHERYWKEDDKAHWESCCLCLLLMNLEVALKVPLADLKLAVMDAETDVVCSCEVRL